MHDKLVTIVDNFYENPEEIRQIALRQSFLEPPCPSGTSQVGPIARRIPCSENIQQSAINKLELIIGRKIGNANIEFRYTLESTVKRVICHADGTQMAGICYLTRPEYCQGGTSFFRHVGTQSIQIDRENEAIYNWADSDEWEKIYSADMAFNRLVIYPGELFHAITTPFFGDSIENGRLTQNFFIDF